MGGPVSNWTPIELPEQEPLPFNPRVKNYGHGWTWTLGFEWLDVTLGGAGPVTGLGLYIQHNGRKNLQPQSYLCFTIKEAIAFAQRCKLPPKIFGRFMNEVIYLGGDHVPKEFQIGGAL
jgi:hypothetical protein